MGLLERRGAQPYRGGNASALLKQGHGVGRVAHVEPAPYRGGNASALLKHVIVITLSGSEGGLPRRERLGLIEARAVDGISK